MLDTPAGTTLLRLTATGSAVLAELLRLSFVVPGPVRAAAAAAAATGGSKRAPSHLPDLTYLTTPETIERAIAASPSLVEADAAFFAAHRPTLSRFHALFTSIVGYGRDLHTFVSDLAGGSYVTVTLDGVVNDPDGKQLLCEAVYWLGMHQLALEEHLPGALRERLLVAWHRCELRSPPVAAEGRTSGAADPTRLTVSLADLAALCRDSGATRKDGRPGCHGGGEVDEGGRPSPPANYPESFLRRAGGSPPPPSLVPRLIARLRSDDVYNGARVWPLPSQRPAALSAQATLLAVLLMYAPETLNTDTGSMREVVDKHFSEGWVVPLGVGIPPLDLSSAWAGRRAAAAALELECLASASVKARLTRHAAALVACETEVVALLKDGALTEATLLDGLPRLVTLLRATNYSLRWVLLHRCTTHKKFGPLVLGWGGWAGSRGRLRHLPCCACFSALPCSSTA